MITLYGLHHKEKDYGIVFYDTVTENLIIEIIGSNGFFQSIKRYNSSDILKFEIQDDTSYCIIIRSSTDTQKIYDTKIYNISDINITQYNSFEDSDDDTICPNEPESDSEIELNIIKL